MMNHISTKRLDEFGITGEITIEDYLIFTGGGDLKCVSEFWKATVSQALLLASTNEEYLAKLEPTHEIRNRDVGSDIELEEIRETYQVANEHLVRAIIFSLLLGFYEYALIKVYNLVLPGSPLCEKPKLIKDIINPLVKENIVEALPDDYKTHVHDYRDDVRNSFAHGRWEELQKATQKIDLHEAFRSVAVYFLQVEDRLKSHPKGFNP